MNLRKIFLISILLLSHHKGMLSKEPTQQKPTSSSSTRKSKRKKTITFLLLSTPIIPVVRFTIKGKRFEGGDDQELINPPNQTSSKPLEGKKATSKKLPQKNKTYTHKKSLFWGLFKVNFNKLIDGWTKKYIKKQIPTDVQNLILQYFFSHDLANLDTYHMPHKQTSYSKRDICFDVKNNLLFKNIVEGARLGIEVHQKNRLQFEHKTTKELDEKSTDFDLTYYPTDQTLFSQEFYSLKIFKIKNYHLQQTHDLTITAHSKFVYVPSIKTCFIANNKYHPEYYELQAYKLPENKLEESLIISQESLHVSHMVYDTKNHILITFIDTMSLADFHPKARIIGYTWSNNTLSQIFDQTDSRVPHLGGVQASEVLYVPSCNSCWVVWRSNMTCSQLVCYEYKIDKGKLVRKKGHRIKLSSSPDHVLLHYNNPKKLLFLAESYWDRLVENLPPSVTIYKSEGSFCTEVSKISIKTSSTIKIHYNQQSNKLLIITEDKKGYQIHIKQLADPLYSTTT